jgi:hypothetical protein
VRDEGASLDAGRGLASIPFEVGTGFERELQLDTRLVLDLLFYLVVAEGQCPAAASWSYLVR